MRNKVPVQPTIAHRRPKAHGLVEMSIQELARTAMQRDPVFRRDDDYETLEIIADPSPAASFSDGWFAEADDLVDEAAPRARHPLRVPLVLIAVALVACVGVLSI